MNPPNEPVYPQSPTTAAYVPDDAPADAVRARCLEQHRAHLEALPDVLWTGGAEGCVAYASPQIEALLGFTREQLYTADDELWIGRIHPDDAEQVWRAYQGVLLGSRESVDLLYRYLRKDGEWIWLRHRLLRRWEYRGASYVDGVISDVTTVFETSRLQCDPTVHQLQPGLTHDFNNLLTAILGYTELVLEDLERDHPSRPALDEIGHAARRAASLMRELGASRRGSDQANVPADDLRQP